MQFFHLFINFGLFAFAARNGTGILRLERMALNVILDNDPSELIESPLLGDWSKNGNELFAFLLGNHLTDFFHQVIIEKGVLLEEAIPIQIENMIRVFKELTSSPFAEFVKESFDLRALIKEIKHSSTLVHFGAVRKMIAKCAQNEYALLSIDIAILKWLSKASRIGMKYNSCVHSKAQYSYIEGNRINSCLLSSLLSLVHRERLKELLRPWLSYLSASLRGEGLELFVCDSCFNTLPNLFMHLDQGEFLPTVMKVHELLAQLVPVDFPPQQVQYSKTLSRQRYSRLQQTFDLKIHAINLDLYYLERLLKNMRISRRFYFLFAIDDGNGLVWNSDDFSSNIRNIPCRAKERRVYFVSLLKPPVGLADRLQSTLRSGFIGEGLNAMEDWKYIALAYGMTVIEFTAPPSYLQQEESHCIVG